MERKAHGKPVTTQSTRTKNGLSQEPLIFSACSSSGAASSQDELDSTMDYSSLDHSFEEFDTNLNDLNDYCLFEIFAHLEIDQMLALKRVSKRFYFMAGKHLATLEQVVLRVNEEHQGPFESCGQHRQTEFNRLNCVSNVKQFLGKFLSKLNRLKVLSLRFLVITEEDLVGLSKLPCFDRTLEHLEISRCEFKNFYMSALVSYEKFFKALGAKLRHFVFIKNKNYIIPSAHLFKFFDQFLTGLDTLVLDLNQFDNLYFVEDLKHSSPIRHLSLHGYHHKAQRSLDRFINRMVVGRHLEFLNLGCIRVEPRSLREIVTSCPAVRVLKFSYDFPEGNPFARRLIRNKEAFASSYFSRLRGELQRDGTVVPQFDLAERICALKQLQELSLLEIVCAEVNIDPLIFFLYHSFKVNQLRTLRIANYELSLINLKAFCYVSRQLEVLSVGEVRACCYKSHPFKWAAIRPTLNESSAQTSKYLPELCTLSLNRCRIDDKTLTVLLSNCGARVVDFSFLQNDGLTAGCLKEFAQYASTRPGRRITVRLDELLVEQIEGVFGPIADACPRNLNIVPC